MIAFVVALVVFLGLIAGNAITYWYLRRYVLKDDRLHYILVRVFLLGNIVFILAILLFFVRIPWKEIASSIPTIFSGMRLFP